MSYTCEICTDYIRPEKTEEILQRVTKIISEAVKRNAPSGTAIPSGANKNWFNVIISQESGDVNELNATPKRCTKTVRAI